MPRWPQWKDRRAGPYGKTIGRGEAHRAPARVLPLLVSQRGRVLWGLSSRARGGQGESSTSGMPGSARAAASTAASSGTSATAAQAAAAAAGGGSHYETLGVAPAAGGGEVRRAYWRQATLTHPDKGGSDEAFAQARPARALADAFRCAGCAAQVLLLAVRQKVWSASRVTAVLPACSALC